ncbi:MAG: hypothetical protein JW953_09950 [Anaerolineae bacterium]|nr:hypothetical protein [Anaerolineae bacterium]
MMTKQKKNFWLDIILLVLFIVTIVSPAGHHSTVGLMIHSVAGAIMILGSLVHVAWHWDWVKANILRYPRVPGRAVLANRRIDLLLLVLLVLCGGSGLLVWVMDLTSLNQVIFLQRHWAGLHRLTGMAMFLLMGPHLAHHAKWLVCMARKCFAPDKPMKLTLDN